MDNKLFIGHDISNNPVSINRDDFVTHGVIVGRTGSGKTGLTHVIIEEAVMKGTSVVVIDPKGDLTNLMLAFPSLTPHEFAPWVSAGKDATTESDKWKEGLRSSGIEAARVLDWKNSATFRVFTPGSNHIGQSVNLLPDFAPPANVDVMARERATHIVSAILGAIGLNVDPLSDSRSVYLTDLLLSRWKRGKSLPLDKWAGLIVDPPKNLQNFDGIAVDDLFPRRERLKLASAIVGFRRQAARWLEGPILDFNKMLLPGEDGRPQVSIFTLRHLNADDRQLFVAMFLSGLVDWMYKAPASGRLRALCVLDEAAGYLPPKPYNPPTKQPIMTLLSQGRAQGLGMLIGTQNPNDLDYKALSNVGTWFLGGLRDRDLKRDLESELKDRGVDAAELLRLPERSFLALTKDGKSQNIRVRWSLSYLRGPIDLNDLSKIPGLNYNIPPKNKLLFGNSDVKFDIDGKLCKDTSVIYSTDNEKTWRRCNVAPGSPKIDKTLAGNSYTYTWDTISDFGPDLATNVILAITISDVIKHRYPLFDIDNRTQIENIYEKYRMEF